MGSLNNMLQATSSIIILAAVAHSAPNPTIPDDDLTAYAEYLDKDPYNNVVRPNCRPNVALLKVGNWSYVRNGSRNTKDVWFTHVAKPQVTWKAASTACKALGKNFYLASIITSSENSKMKGLHGDNAGNKAWVGGYYDSDSGKYKWSNGGKDTDEVFGYTSWYSGYPSYDPSMYVRTDTTKSDNNMKDASSTDNRSYVCMLRCKTNYWKS